MKGAKYSVKKKIPLIIGIILIIFALGLMAYPSFVICINEMHSTSEINSYSEKVNELTDTEVNEYIKEAIEYNENLKSVVSGFSYSIDSDIEGYEEILNFQNGIVGYIKIPVIDVNLPIYHGSDETCLSKGVAHLPNTAFPVGGLGNHCVLAAHTAYSNQIFFDHIDKLVPGDKIYIIILNKTYVYEVRETNIVIPTDTSPCAVVNGKDLLSLVTCYPYAQNTHRLIVTAERIETITDDSDADSDGGIIQSIDNASYDESNIIGLATGAFTKFFGTKLNTHDYVVLGFFIIVFIAIILILILIIKGIIDSIKSKKDNMIL